MSDDDFRLFACGCPWDAESVHICDRRPKFTGTVEKVYRREEEGCRCVDAWTGRRLSKLRRHKSPTECLPQEAVEAFMATHGLRSEGHARAMMAIEAWAPKGKG